MTETRILVEVTPGRFINVNDIRYVLNNDIHKTLRKNHSPREVIMRNGEIIGIDKSTFAYLLSNFGVH